MLSGDFDDDGGFPVEVGNLYHSEMGRFKGDSPLGKFSPGRVPPFPISGHGVRRNGAFIDDAEDFRDKSARPFEGTNFPGFAKLVRNVPTNVRRL